MNSNSKPLWMGRPIVRAEHADELERDAALNEFHSKMPRHLAEEKAHQDYIRRQHIDAAAHHLQGMKAAQANADMEDAQKHGAMYEMHIKALGLESLGPVPHEIKMASEQPDRKPIYRFKAHHGDFFVLPPDSSLNKFENNFNEFDSLEKSMSKTEMEGHLRSFGWLPDKNTKEEYWYHPVITKESYALTGRPQRVSFSMSNAHKVPTNKMKWILREAGLELDGRGGVQASKDHVFYKLYQKSGHVPPEENPMKTWNSNAPGVQHIELSKLVPTKNVPDSEAWRVDKHVSFLKNNQSIPHITAKQDGEKFLVQDGHDVLSAAQQAGMTHAPVLIKKT